MTDKTDALIEQVEQMVGMGHAAWDTINPREIAAAFCKALALPAASVDVLARLECVIKTAAALRRQLGDGPHCEHLATISGQAAIVKLRLTAPAEGMDVEAIMEVVESYAGKHRSTSRYIRQDLTKLIDSAGGAKGITGSVSPQMRDANACTPQPAEGDGAVGDALQFVRPNTPS